MLAQAERRADKLRLAEPRSFSCGFAPCVHLWFQLLLLELFACLVALLLG